MSISSGSGSSTPNPSPPSPPATGHLFPHHKSIVTALGTVAAVVFSAMQLVGGLSPRGQLAICALIAAGGVVILHRTSRPRAALAATIGVVAAVIFGTLVAVFNAPDNTATAGGGTSSPPAGTPAPSISPASTHPPTPTPTAAPSTTPVIQPRYIKPFTIAYIDNTGYIDLDKPFVWDGDQDENAETVDIAINSAEVGRRTFATVAPSKAVTKTGCLAALGHPVARIPMAQVRRDGGFCARSGKGLIAYVRFLALTSGDNDHSIDLQVTAYR
jgi:hypothetical protein